MNCLYYIVRLADETKRPAGPFRLSAVMDQLKGGLLSWTDIAWTPHQKEPWRRLYEFPELHEILPKFPSESELQSYTEQCLTPRTESTTSTSIESVLKPPFYLHVIGSERGPFSLAEVRELLQRAKFEDQVYLWCKGLSFWVPIQEVPEFSHLKFQNSRMTKTRNDVFANAVSNKEERAANRESLVSTVRVRNRHTGMECLGICLDASVTGMQVRLENFIPIAKGEEVDLEIIPLSLFKLPPLKARGRAAWFNEETLCFGAEFIGFERDGWERLKSYFK